MWRSVELWKEKLASLQNAACGNENRCQVSGYREDGEGNGRELAIARNCAVERKEKRLQREFA